MNTRTQYQDTVKLTCLENDKTLTGEILDYKPGYMLAASVDRRVRVTLRYNVEKKLYIGRVGALEFVSKGPEKTVIAEGRRG